MKRLFLVAAASATLFAAVVTTGTASASPWSNFWAALRGGQAAQATTPALAPVPAVAPAPTPAAPRATYAALGDSVAAGIGLTPVTSPAGNDALCGRSTESYTYTVANTMGLPLAHIACSGATVGDLFTKQSVNGPNITAQLDTAFATGTPELITITAGANDAHWAEFIRGCYATSCNNASATFLANGYLTALQAKLFAAFSSINYRSAGKPPTVVVTSYYNALSATCTQFQTNITAEEIAWLNAETNALNQTIAGVASRYPFVRVAPVDFTGHDICSADSWVQGPTDPAPFHPTAAGQQAIARSVLASLGR